MKHPVVGIVVVLAVLSAVVSADGRKFYDDDPLTREPESQDASKAEPWDINLFWDLTSNMFARLGDPATNVRAQNVNTIDEVPDSGWFTNRILARPLSIDEITRGPLADPPPETARWTVTRPEEAGAAPGFTARDDKGGLWFISFDANKYPEAATGAQLVANKIFWALGYWQVENYLVSIRREQVVIDDAARVTPPSGKRRLMEQKDLDEVFARSARSVDGSYRAVAARGLPGKILGGFKYYGTRPDDPNDLVPHEHRRELRALKVFGAWTNLVDMKAGNTLDTVLPDSRGRGIVQHYLQDVGSTFGTGANGFHDYDEGFEPLYDLERVWKRLVTFGFRVEPWMTAEYVEYGSIGRFEAKAFDPETWSPRVPHSAFRQARADDNFWAARRVMAFTDEMIHAMVKTGRYTDPKAETYLAEVLIARRDRIARVYLNAVNPLIDFALDASGTLTFRNAAVESQVAEPPSGGYTTSWARFDNATGAVTPVGAPGRATSAQFLAPSDLPSVPGTFVKVEVTAVEPTHPEWAQPVSVYFRRERAGWKLVGLERFPTSASR